MEKDILRTVADDFGAPADFKDEPKVKFDVDAFPRVAADYIKAVADELRASKEMTGCFVLGVVALASQMHKIQIRGNRRESLSLWVCTVASSGEMKSPCLNAPLSILDKWTAEYNATHREDFARDNFRKTQLEKQLSQLQKKAVDDITFYSEAEAVALELSSFKQQVPKRLYVSDATTEALACLMENQGGNLGVFSTEGAFLNNILGQYSNGKINAEAVNRAYDNDVITVDRVTRDTVTVDSPNLSVVQAIQPTIFEKVKGNPELCGTGFLNRFLICSPPSHIGKQRFNSPVVPENVRREFADMIYSLLNESDAPRTLVFSKDAQKMFGDYYDYFYSVRISRGDFEGLNGWAAKHMTRVAKLSALLQLIENPRAQIVSDESVSRAILLSAYFEEQAALIFRGHLLNSDEILAKYLWGRIRDLHSKGKTRADNGLIKLDYRVLKQSINKVGLKFKADYVKPLNVLQDMELLDFEDENLTSIILNPKGLE